MEIDYYDRRKSMLDNVAKSDAFFKSQQKDEADLTFQEKRSIAEEILKGSKTLFLRRFHTVLLVEDLCLFDDCKEDYEVDYYMKEVVKLNDSKLNSTQVKNRRYEALQRLIKSGDYFKDSEMKKRDPLLYEQMIGCHLSEKEKEELQPTENTLSFASFLMNTIDKDAENQLMKRCLDQEESAWEENDSDEDWNEQEKKQGDVTDEEKRMLRNEFTNVMYERFLSGKDDYDYRAVDNNTEYDSWQLHQQDEEEKYFDSEDQ